MKNIKLKLFLILICGTNIILSTATNYYVSPNGSDDNDGKSMQKPKKTLQKAADLTRPGDTVFVMQGTYTTSGTSLLDLNRNKKHSGAENAYITYKPYPGHKVKMTAALSTSSSVWNLILINADYIVFEGFELKGSTQQLTHEEAMASYEEALAGGNDWTKYGRYNTNALTIGGSNNQSLYPFHVIIRNCMVHDFPGAGICAQEADYITVVNNLVYNNCWRMMYAGSGISNLHMVNTDNNTGYKNFVCNNICYNNKTLVPWIALKRLSDGNGIIIDDNLNEQESRIKGQPYKGRTLVMNNLSYNNGGSGMHAYLCNNVDFVNNTAYMNGTVMGYGDISAGTSRNCNLINNIMYARSDGRCNENPSNENVVYDYNIYYNGRVETTGPHDKVVDPLFQNLSIDPDESDFRLRSGSPAIAGGTRTDYTPSADIEGKERPVNRQPDIGAYMFEDGVTSNVSFSQPFTGLFLNGNILTIKETIPENYHLIISTLSGQKINPHSITKVSNNEIQVNVSGLTNGIYFIILQGNNYLRSSACYIKS